MLEIEVNSATDNPLVFPEGADVDPTAVATGGGRVISGGNFHGQPVALAMDLLAIAVAELGSISERRIAQLIDARTSGLPPFLVENAGLNSGMMLYQYAAAALVSENKVLAHPASVDSIPTSANQEDHVSMGPIAARQAREVVRNVEHVLALELLCAAQGLDFRLADGPRARRGRRGGASAAARARRATSTTTATRGADIAAAVELVRSGALGDLLPAGLSAMTEVSRSSTSATPTLRADPAVRRSALRPPHLRLLGGRRPRLEGQPAVVARGSLRRRRAARRRWPTTRSRRRPRRAATTRSRRPAASHAPLPTTTCSPPDDNPFAPKVVRERPLREGVPRKLALLDRGRGVFGSYAKVLLVGRRAGRVLPVRPAVGLSARHSAARPVPAAARCAAAGGHHVHRLDRRGRAPGHARRWSKTSARTSPGAASRRSRRTPT